MKSNKTMYALAKAKAIEAGPRFIDPVTGEIGSEPKGPEPIAAYGLSMADLKALYGENGFSVKGDALERHLATWDFLKDRIWRSKDYPWVFFRDCGHDDVLNALQRAIPGLRVIA